MKDDTEKIIEEFPEEIRDATAAIPCGDRLFQIRPTNKSRPLPEEQAAQLHGCVVQLSLIGMHARRDVQTAVAFLRTRVNNPDEDEWGKLQQVIKYLNGS